MTEKNPAVTVVMVAFNHAKYLRETMASVFAQTMADLEVILIDNGSSDESPQIIAALEDPRLVKIRQENLGLSLAYNIGIERARGRWIALANADDTWRKDKLELQIQALEKRKAGAAFSAAALIDDAGKPIPEDIAAQFPFSFEDLPRAQMYEKFFFKTNFMCATSAVIDAGLLAKSAFDPCLIQLQDFDVWVRLIKSVDFAVLPEKLVGYRVRCDGQNLSLDKRNRARVLFELNLAYKRFFDDAAEDFFKAAFSKHFRNADAKGDLAMEFEKAFLFLRMQEPSISALGLERLYALLAIPEARKIAESDYALKIENLWELARMPVYADSQSLEQALLEAGEKAARLAQSEAELAELRRTMQQITSGKLWKLREKMHGILGR